MKDLDIPRIEDFIKKLGVKDLLYLNNIIVERLKVLSQIKSSEKMAQFHTGQRVSFKLSGDIIKKGFITRMHKKTVTLRTEDGELWKIAPGLLKAED